MRNLVEVLLKRIYHYYPIGNPSLNTLYSGHTELTKIIEKKINQIILKEETPWNYLVSDLRNEFSTQVLDKGYLQFASYIASIEKDTKEESLFYFSKKIVINISLLCPYYTIYYEDSFLFRYGESLLDPPTFRIFFSKDINAEKGEPSELLPLRKKIENFFPRYSFVNHKLLFDYTLSSAAPYSHDINDSQKSFPIYLFLFDPYLLLKNLEVV